MNDEAMNTPATRWEDVYKTQTARIAELERENAALRCQAIGQEETITRLQCTIKAAMHVEGQLQAENAALRADAERYRWIKRDNIGVHDVLELFMSYINCDLDKEIDQTRAKEAKP